MQSMLDISKILPQKYPFLMLDAVIAFEKGKSLTAIKNITGSEWVFEKEEGLSGIFPETLIIEAAAQAALALYQLTHNPNNQQLKFILGKIKSVFISSCSVGDQVTFLVNASKMLKDLGYMDVEIKIFDKSIGQIMIMYSISIN